MVGVGGGEGGGGGGGRGGINLIKINRRRVRHKKRSMGKARDSSEKKERGA